MAPMDIFHTKMDITTHLEFHGISMYFTTALILFSFFHRSTWHYPSLGGSSHGSWLWLSSPQFFEWINPTKIPFITFLSGLTLQKSHVNHWDYNPQPRAVGRSPPFVGSSWDLPEGNPWLHRRRTSLDPSSPSERDAWRGRTGPTGSPQFVVTSSLMFVIFVP